MFEFLVIIAVFASIVTAGLYIHSMYRGYAKPNRVTWLMWSIAPFIVITAGIHSGVTWAVIPVFMSGFGPFLIFIASFFFKGAYWKLGAFDYLCGVISVLALLLWVITQQPVISIALAIISDTMAAVPTFTKTWSNPETESIWPFITGTFNAITSLIVAVTWNFTEIAFPIYLFALNILLIILIYRKKYLNSSDE
jgi:hypothetical protein